MPWTYAISDLNVEEIAGNFYENELQKTNQKEFRIEKKKKIKGKEITCMTNEKDIIILLISGLTKKIL